MEGLCGHKVLLLWTWIISLANLPEDITEPSTKAPEHHVIIVSCTHSRRFHGPEIISNTQHCHGGDTLHVTVFNKHFENKSTTYDVAALYNDKAVTGFLVFLLILTSAAVLQVIYKMYVQKHVHKLRTSREVNENTTFQSAASPRSLKTLLLSAGIICQITTTAGQWFTASSPLQCSYPIKLRNEINQTVSTKLPAKIEAKLPPNCKDLSTDYTCWERDRVSESKLVSELEPFTDYSCIGQIKNNTDTIQNTTAVHVRIDCDFTIINRESRATNTSIALSWNTDSEKCQDVLHELDKLSYDCSCDPFNSHQRHWTFVTATVNKQPPGGTCHITGLKPDTDYTCEIQPTYNNTKRDAKQTKVTQRTDVGVPEDIKDLKTEQPEHNVITVSCTYSREFNGPEGKYKARLRDGVTVKQHESKDCKFEFKDLSYSTTYTVEVVAFNGRFESNPRTKAVTTKCMCCSNQYHCLMRPFEHSLL
ncbi:uncharacterized protein [Trachinotus anak]|uniref:uncharacterized protein n=1 Tax=Trachinotus anak TaxID=443729 RepID=UPI0039F1E8B9